MIYPLLRSNHPSHSLAFQTAPMLRIINNHLVLHTAALVLLSHTSLLHNKTSSNRTCFCQLQLLQFLRYTLFGFLLLDVKTILAKLIAAELKQVLTS